MDRTYLGYRDDRPHRGHLWAWVVVVLFVSVVLACFGIGKTFAATDHELLIAVDRMLPIAQNMTRIPADLVAPDARVVSAEEMPCACAALYHYEGDVQPRELGYDQPAELLVRDDVKLADALGQSIVLHELVHHVQAVAGGSAAYGTAEWQARERAAYAVQYRWLRGVGAMADLRRVGVRARDPRTRSTDPERDQ